MRRFEYLDIAKGIGILLVVWAHILITGGSHRVIYAFHMPLFFLVSGMLFRRDKYKGFFDFVRKRATRLLVPFVVYSIVTWFIWAIFRFVSHDSVVSYWDPLLQTVIAKGSGAYMVHNSALWFIPCLFATEIMYFLFSKATDIAKIAIAVCLATLSFTLGHYFKDDWWFLLPWNFDAALIGVLFYCIGNVLVSRVSNMKIDEWAKGHMTLVAVLLSIFAVVLYWSSMAFGECSMGSSSYQCSGAIFVVRALVGCVACLLLSLLLSRISTRNIIKRYLMRQGSCSLDIMSLHIPVKGIAILGLSLIIHISSDAISSSVAYSAMAFTITMLVVDAMVWMIDKGKAIYNKMLHGEGQAR